MNLTLMAAAVLSVVIALIHSVLGERRIFRRLRRATASTVIPLSGFHIGILWASWHLVTVFGLALAACLACLALPDGVKALPVVLHWATALGMACGAVLIAVGTRFKHPAWLGLLVVAGLVLVAS
jgi:hypothetical protein